LCLQIAAAAAAASMAGSRQSLGHYLNWIMREITIKFELSREGWSRYEDENTDFVRQSIDR
jgi:hypothetical protein